MQNTKRMWVWVGVAVVVIAVVLAFVWKPSAQTPASAPPTVTYAPAGQITPTFPVGLILGSTSTVTSSYYIAYSSGPKQSTTVFNSTSSMQALYISYLEYFLDHQWKITSNVIKYPDSRGIQATASSSSASVSIVAEKEGSQATVTLVTQ